MTVVFGPTLFIATPRTFRFLKVDPSELVVEELPSAEADATARTTSAVTTPLRMFTPSTSAVPVSDARAGSSETTLELVVCSRPARSTFPVGGKRLTLSKESASLSAPTPD